MFCMQILIELWSKVSERCLYGSFQIFLAESFSIIIFSRIKCSVTTMLRPASIDDFNCNIHFFKRLDVNSRFYYRNTCVSRIMFIFPRSNSNFVRPLSEQTTKVLANYFSIYIYILIQLHTNNDIRVFRHFLPYSYYCRLRQ